MVNDPKDDNDLENLDNPENEALSETEKSTDEEEDHAAESSESESEPSEGELAAEGDIVPEETDDVEDAVLVEDANGESSEEADATETEVVESVPAPEKQSGGNSSLGMVFGGLIAGGIGFLAATFGVPDGWPNGTQPQDDELREQLAATTEDLAAQSSRSDALQADLEALTEALASASPGSESASSGEINQISETVDSLSTELGAVSGRLAETASGLEDFDASLGDIATALSTLKESLDGFEERLAVLETRPSVVAPDGSAAMESQLQAFREELDAVTAAAREEIEASQERASLIEAEALAAVEEAEARASQMEAEAVAAEELANQRAALAQVTAALESGGPFVDAIAAFPDAPEILTAVAEDGVATLSALQSSFPAAARSALSSAEAVPEDAGAGDRLAAFLRRQTNARSLAPKEGDGTDAILSRAEALLNNGDLDATLAELEALAEAPKAAVSSWVEMAQTRAAALMAASSLPSALN